MGGEQYVDALVDTGSTYCILPRRAAHLLGFNKDNRLGTTRVSVVGGAGWIATAWNSSG